MDNINRPRDKISRIGKPEQLKHYERREVWFRRISKHHRMVYEIKGDCIIVHLLLGHYDDK
nr:type II toxin-antitoxin system YoeB family toxin [Candidatus Azobacteroides pseudotrichonymphae]